jgi:hypothetical protein
MKLEDQVCSLELSKRLKELGVKQESLFYWHVLLDATAWANGHRHEDVEIRQDNVEHGDYDVAYSAFTVAELGEMLPFRIDGKDITDKRRTIAYFLEYEAGGISVRYTHHLNVTKVLVERVADTEADARTSMLIYLIENNLITI